MSTEETAVVVSSPEVAASSNVSSTEGAGTIERLGIPRRTLSSEAEPGFGGAETATAAVPLPPRLGFEDLDPAEERRRVLSERLVEQYAVVNGVYSDPARPNAPLFRTDGVSRIKAHDVRPQSVRSMVDLAEASGWNALRVDGVPEFQRAVWIEATSRQIHVRLQPSRLGPAYEPTEVDRLIAARQHQARFGGKERPDLTPDAEKAATELSADQRIGARRVPPPSVGTERNDTTRHDASHPTKESAEARSSVAGGASAEAKVGDSEPKPSNAIRLLELQLRSMGFNARERQRILSKAAEKEAKLVEDGKRLAVKVNDPAAPREAQRAVEPVRSTTRPCERSVGR